jgi:predicted aconitase with swiveling domain
VTVRIRGRSVVKGRAKGVALVTSHPVSFFGGVDPDEGTIVEAGHDLAGCTITGKVLVFPRGKGSTVGSYVLYAMKKKGTAPVAIINLETEPIIAVGCTLADIPLVDHLDEDPVAAIRTGDFVEVAADTGVITITPGHRTTASLR